MGSAQSVPHSAHTDFHIGNGPVLHCHADDSRKKTKSFFNFYADSRSCEPHPVSLYFVINEMNLANKKRRRNENPPSFLFCEFIQR